MASETADVTPEMEQGRPSTPSRAQPASVPRREPTTVGQQLSSGGEGSGFRSSVTRDEGDGAPVSETTLPTDPSTARHIPYVKERPRPFSVQVEFDMVQFILFIIALCTRMWRLEHPNGIVFDELHYLHFTHLYLNGTFFFDHHPPLAKMLFAFAGYLSGYTPTKNYDNIGLEFSPDVPIWYLRFVPAFLGSLLVPAVYQIMVEMKMSRWTAAIAAILVIAENSFLVQSRLMMAESLVLFLSAAALLTLLKFRNLSHRPFTPPWWTCLVLLGVCMACCIATKYIGSMTALLVLIIISRDLWSMLADVTISDMTLFKHTASRILCLLVLPFTIYIGIFYAHLSILTKAGPNNQMMTSQFQASLEGGLAAITMGQPLYISYGSQITLRHTFGPPCWLHSHNAVYPIRYEDGRGSSHQQQVTCYSYKDVNNWWLVKHPGKNVTVVQDPPPKIKHGDVVELLHGITGRLLNSHDVAAPISPMNQEVSCYVDYNVSMTPQNLWRVEIMNKDTEGEYWQTIRSHVRLVHVKTEQALKLTGMHLPEWGFNQLEVATDKDTGQESVVWNVEEHKYTLAENDKTEQEVLKSSEFIPTEPMHLTFWQKFSELQMKMWMVRVDEEMDHRFSSTPFDWLVDDRNIGYWLSPSGNAQIHLIGNVVSWYSALPGFILFVLAFVSIVLARKRALTFVPEDYLEHMQFIAELLIGGYLLHYIPFHLVESTYFLYHYLPAVLFKLMFVAVLMEQAYLLIASNPRLHHLAVGLIGLWLFAVVMVFYRFLGVTYGLVNYTKEQLMALALKSTWDFVLRS
ncbi:protein O-mannosyl-transferase 1-like [Lineus longissimus]|uniref:protein O-mannosyl-transferase 1-like n=1 Tax=Lineus longissimus TaxID=88925 RepID=UPI002B4D1A50